MSFTITSMKQLEEYIKWRDEQPCEVCGKTAKEKEVWVTETICQPCFNAQIKRQQEEETF
jgi:hypothetical protein